MTGVVVVDDDFMVRAIHEAYVNDLDGHHVIGTAASGSEALTVLDELVADVVLLDVHLPDMTGIDVLHELRRRGNYVGVIMVTAERQADVVRSALRGGASQYLIKPFSPGELHDRLHAFARSRRAMEARLQGSQAQQDDVDVLFAHSTVGSRTPDLPKGLSRQSLQLVRAALSEHGELSASDCAEFTGMARVSTRRYLEYLVQSQQADMRLQYGAGRPIRMFRLMDVPPRGVG